MSYNQSEEEDKIRQSGYLACKKDVLEILKQKIQNRDLSWESCDKRFIEKIENL